MSVSMAEKLMHATVRIECESNDNKIVTGTGFFFAFGGRADPSTSIIVTNQHVIEGSAKGRLIFTEKDLNGNPIVGSYQQVLLDNFQSLWVRHPEKEVDLAALSVAEVLQRHSRNEIGCFVAPLDETSIPTTEVMKTLSGIEDIIMIGYPNGIWDQRNNMPIVRKGITATNPKLDYNGLPIFVIDCACFPGSSGSPVIIYDQGGYRDAEDRLILGANRLILLGVLFAGPQHQAEGEIKTINIPLQNIAIALSQIPNNLGFVIKSEKILDFKPFFMGS